MKYIAITGASGVLGTRIQQFFKNSKFHIFNQDIRDEIAVMKFCRESVECDAFFHLAALVPKQTVDNNPTEAFDINVRGTLNILKGLKQLKDCSPWMFFASSSHVYASLESPIAENGILDPFTLYGLTKLQGEEWCKAYAREFGLRICIGRLFSFSDPLQSRLYFIPAMIQKIRTAKLNETLLIPGLDGKRDFITITQICQAIEILFTHKYQGPINIGTGVATQLLDIVQKIILLLGREDLIIKGIKEKTTFHVADNTLLKSMSGEISSQLDELIFNIINSLLNDDQEKNIFLNSPNLHPGA